MSDVFASAHKAREQAVKREQVKQELEQRTQATAKRLLDGMKQPFNDLPRYRPKDPFKLMGPT